LDKEELWVMRTGVLAAFLFLGATAWTGARAEVTFHKSVLPVLQKNCQGCHRPGEAAPMSLLTYQEARPWAKAIRESVLTKRMPPWFADPEVGKFRNDRRLSADEIDIVTRWVAAGALEGDPNDAPPPHQFATGWRIGEPDAVFELPVEVDVAAEGTIEYTYVIVPTGFTEDKWVQLSEARPGNSAVVHHIIAFVRAPGSKWLKDYAPGVPFIPDRKSEEGAGEFLTGYAPGTPPEDYPPSEGKLIKAGSDLVFQLHYTANGKAAKDRSRVGLVFSKEKPQRRVLTLMAANREFVIPPGAPNHAVEASMTLWGDSELLGLLPHMHLRGKAMNYRAVYPDGRTEELLRVPRYDFNWQLGYDLAERKFLPKGTRIEATGYFDNSPNNKDNPNPAAEVRWGDQSWEEMMAAFFWVTIPADQDPAELLRKPKKPMSDD
jgi:mono/diheme cytochrome c family protein